MTRHGAAGSVAAALLVGFAAPAAAQSTDAILAGPDGVAAFEVAISDQVRVCERGIERPEGRWMRWSDGRDLGRCVQGRLEVRAEVRDGRVLGIDLGPPGGGVVDRTVGSVPPDAAAAWLVEVPWNTPDADAAGTAWMSLGLLDDVDVSTRMAEGVRDRSLPSAVRRQLLFWAGQVVSDGLTAALGELATADAEDQELRDQAIFALSQRPAAESVPLLMELAEDAPHPGSRKTALFWLAQNDSDEVADFFARLILRGAGG